MYNEKLSVDMLKGLSIVSKANVLWHYTTLDSATKIINSGNLLASDFRFLNDAMEMKTGFHMVQSWMVQHENEEVRGLLDNEDQFMTSLGAGGWPYIVSFSEAKDSLSMWRGYSDLVVGNGGVAIGFSMEDLGALATPQIFGNPKKSIYVRREYYEYLDEAYRQLDPRAPASALFGELRNRIPLGKNRYFKEEREWRLLGIPFPSDEHLMEEIGGQFRLRFDLEKRTPISHPIAENPLGIVEVMAGPKTQLAKLEQFCSFAFKLKELDIPRLTQSKIPFV